jgi:phage terminase large subunit
MKLNSPIKVEIELPNKFQALFKPKRIKIFYGGRGGAKSVSFAKALLFRCHREKTRVLCMREFMNSMDDSVHSMLAEEIETMQMGDKLKAQANQINGSNGSAVRYAQLARNLASIKSKHAFDIGWIEEAETVTQRSLDVLIPTLRKENSELWISFNPSEEDGAVYSEYIKPHEDIIERQGFYEDEHLYVCKVGLDDNPFAPQELIDASAAMKKQAYKKWLHIYGGYPNTNYEDSIIQPEWFEAAIDAHLKLKTIKAEGVKSLGFDPADNGADAKATALRHGSLVTHIYEWDDGELPDAIDKAFMQAYDLRADFLVYDADGLGAGVKVGLEKRIEGKSLVVDAYRGGARVDNPDVKYADSTNKNIFKNKRAQYWWLLRDRFEATYNAINHGVYSDPDLLISLKSDIPHLKALKSELTRVKRKTSNNSSIQLESKDDMRKRGVHSPNLGDALVMCFANSPIKGASTTINFEGW